MSMKGSILTLNAGSSSVKFALFDTEANLKNTVRGEIEDLTRRPICSPAMAAARPGRKEAGRPERRRSHRPGCVAGVRRRTSRPRRAGGRRPSHRAWRRRPHRARAYHACLLTALEALTPLDPLHMPDNLAPIHAVARGPSHAPAGRLFRHRVSPYAAAGGQRFALPREISDAGVRRYGFHGLSYEYIAGCLNQQFPALARGRVVVAHLGSGASLCALA